MLFLLAMHYFCLFRGAAEDLRDKRAVELREGKKRLGRFRGLAQQLFRPGHIVPAAELVTAAPENPDAAEAQMLVEADAVVRQIFVVLALRLADAGIEVVNALRAGNVLERAVKTLAEALMARFEREVDRRLGAAVVGRAWNEGVRVGIAERVAGGVLGDAIRLGSREIRDAAAEFLERGHIVFKRNGRLLDIGRVDRQQRRCVVRRCEAETERGSRHIDHLSKPCTQSERR